MVWSTFAVSGGVGFRYITEPTNWPKFWLDLMDIPDLDRARWRDPGDSVRLTTRPCVSWKPTATRIAPGRSAVQRADPRGSPCPAPGATTIVNFSPLV